MMPSALYALKLGLEPTEGDPMPEEVESARKTQEAEDHWVFAMAEKYKEKELGLALKPVVKRSIRTRPKPVGERDLRTFVPLKAPVDPLKERSRVEVERVSKKRRKVVTEGREEGSMAKKAKEELVGSGETVVEAPVVGIEVGEARPGMVVEGDESDPPIAEMVDLVGAEEEQRKEQIADLPPSEAETEVAKGARV